MHPKYTVTAALNYEKIGKKIHKEYQILKAHSQV